MSLSSTVLVVYLRFLMLNSVSLAAEITEIQCEGFAMNLQCDGGSKIQINYANYGRTDRSECRIIHSDPQFDRDSCIGAHSDGIIKTRQDKTVVAVLRICSYTVLYYYYVPKN